MKMHSNLILKQAVVTATSVTATSVFWKVKHIGRKRDSKRNANNSTAPEHNSAQEHNSAPEHNSAQEHNSEQEHNSAQEHTSAPEITG